MQSSPLQPLHAATGAQPAPPEWGGLPWSFGDPAAEHEAARSACALFDLTHDGVIELEGADTRRFANSQLTNNFRDLPVGGALRAGITDRKGRLEGLVHALLVADDRLLIACDGLDVEWLMERLDAYIIMDPIELRDRSEALGRLSVQGPGAGAALEAVGATPPEAGGSSAWRGGHVLRRARGRGEGFDLLLPADALVGAWQDLRAAGARPAGVAALEALRVEAVAPRWPVDMGERSFLHELGLVSELVSFNKGCYIGQEVINRMETMGRPTRRLAALELASEAAPGAPVLHEGKRVGELSSIAEIDGRWRGLALLRVAAADPGTGLEVGEGAGAVAARVAPPS